MFKRQGFCRSWVSLRRRRGRQAVFREQFLAHLFCFLLLIWPARSGRKIFQRGLLCKILCLTVPAAPARQSLVRPCLGKNWPYIRGAGAPDRLEWGPVSAKTGPIWRAGAPDRLLVRPCFGKNWPYFRPGAAQALVSANKNWCYIDKFYRD